MTNITMKQLRYFDALARHGHFGRAAAACAISQPALSVQVRELEETLGASLVERGPRQVRLTGLGEEFAERAHAILRSVDDLANLARASRGKMAGQLRIGFIPTVAPYVLPGFAAELAGRYPDLALSPREAITEKLLQALRDGRLDAAVVALPLSEPSLHEMPLFDEEFVLVRSEEEADKPVPDSKTLREMRLLLLEEGHCFRDQALSFCNLTSPLPRDLMEGSSLSTLVRMVGAGIGVTLIPEMAVPFETRTAPVSVAHLAKPRPSRSIGLVWRKTNPLADQLRLLAEILRETATGQLPE
ncbi:MAG: LysR substrate-binding domain-containing protein [Rhodobacteraceae bacterium]|nr:LysR substrate-binding domain-containing protein [Paracoccaceae bacterium]MCW9042020.1 LysR substrate-binding domain-containing protein [Pseudopelagicola sp.]